MKTSDWIPIAMERSNAMLAYWNTLLVLAMGILAACVTLPGQDRRAAVCLGIFLTVTYIFAAISNARAMLSVIRQRQSIYHLINEDQVHGQTVPPEFVKTLRPDDAGFCLGFHAFLDVVAIEVMWALLLVRSH